MIIKRVHSDKKDDVAISVERMRALSQESTRTWLLAEWPSEEVREAKEWIVNERTVLKGVMLGNGTGIVGDELILYVEDLEC